MKGIKRVRCAKRAAGRCKAAGACADNSSRSRLCESSFVEGDTAARSIQRRFGAQNGCAGRSRAVLRGSVFKYATERKGEGDTAARRFQRQKPEKCRPPDSVNNPSLDGETPRAAPRGAAELGWYRAFPAPLCCIRTGALFFLIPSRAPQPRRHPPHPRRGI